MKVKETYCDTKTGITFRIINISDKNIYYVNIDGKCYAPKLMTKERLTGMLQSGAVKKVSDPYLTFETVELKGKALERSKRNWEWIKELWGSHKQELLEKKTRANIIKNFAQSKGVSLTSIKNLLANFYSRGMDKNSVATGLNRCGSAGKQRNLTVKPGPKGGTQSLPTKSLEDIFTKAYRKYYLNSPQSSLQQAYEKMLDHFFRKEGKLQMQERPSYLQFWRWASKQELEEKITGKFSQNEFDLKHRVLKSSTNADVEGPGDIFEIDATPLDCHIVSRSNRNKLIGRPILYIIIDRYSRMIVGMNVGLEGPSWAGAMAALENMIEDKVAYCRRFGVEITKEDWPVEGIIPYSIIGDRGEMIGKGPDEVVKNLKARIRNAAPYRGDLKGNVERSFGTINRKIKQQIDGAVLKEYRKRGDSDPRDSAKLNLEEVTKAVIYCVLYYNKHLIEDFPLSEDQIAYEVVPQPLDLWNYGVDHYLYSFTEVDALSFRKSILPTIKRTVTRRGIRFKNFYYTAPDPKTETWILNNLGERFYFAYDLLDISEGYVRTDHEDIRLVLSNTFSSYRGMTFEEAKRYDELRKERLGNLEEISLETSIKLNNNLEQLNKSVPKPDRSVSKAKRKKGIKENRRKERLGNSEVVLDEEKLPFHTDEQDPLANNYEAIRNALERSNNNERS